jgi:hypothetical protein
MAARWTNFWLAVWLLLSGFLWQHGDAQEANTWVIGMLMLVAVLVALHEPRVRFLNTALGAWLVASAWALPHDRAATRWNAVIVGALVVALSLLPSRERRPREGRDVAAAGV